MTLGAGSSKSSTGGGGGGAEIGGKFGRLMEIKVSSPTSSIEFWLGIAVKLGFSSTKGAPSLVQNRITSSSYLVWHLGQNFIFSGF